MRMPFARRILTAPLAYISSCPMTPSTFCSASVVLPAEGVALGAGGFVSGAKVTFRSPVESVGFGADGCSARAASACAEGEMKVGKGEGNWKK